MSKYTVHQIKIDFHVTEQICRFVYVYIIEGKSLYLIDSGVFGCEKQIIDYLNTIGRRVSEIRGIFLTHAHPDHIGSAAWFQEHTGCKIYTSEGEKRWIEDIDLEFRERPIPNFYRLAGRSSRVDVVVRDGDVIKPEESMEIQVRRTAGHSSDGISYLLEDSLFIGDAVPVRGDIPIFIDEREIRKTLSILGEMQDVNVFYPAWDQTYSKEMMKRKLFEADTYSKEMMKRKLFEADELINLLKKTVTELDNPENAGEQKSISELVDAVCDRLKMPMLKANPLFQTTIGCLR